MVDVYTQLAACQATLLYERRRREEAEAIIRAQCALQMAMYDTEIEAVWPQEARQLRQSYEQTHGVDFWEGVK